MYYKHYYDNIAKFHFLRGNNMKKERLKDQKGFAGSDALIAVLIIALFAGLIATISYNIYLSSSSTKRMSKATAYIVDVFEYIDKIYYDSITEENLIRYFNNKYYYESDGVTPKAGAEVRINRQDENIDTPFKVRLSLVKYNQTEGNTDKLDLVQEITMTVTYKLGDKDQKIEMKKIKSRENLETPNSPDMSILKLDQGFHAYPIKKVNNNWMACDERDNSWYDYETGKWALILKTNRELSVNQQIDTNNLLTNEEIYAWIPRFAYDRNNNSIIFLFSNTNNYIDNTTQYSKLVNINEAYQILADFTNNQKELIGIWTKDSTNTAYQTLESIYPLKK